MESSYIMCTNRKLGYKCVQVGKSCNIMHRVFRYIWTKSH